MMAKRTVLPTKLDDYFQKGLIAFFLISVLVPQIYDYTEKYCAVPIMTWQLFSALYYVFMLSDQKRIPYLFYMALWGLSILVTFYFDFILIHKVLLLLGGLLLIGEYAKITKDLISKHGYQRKFKKNDPNILDDVDWQEPQAPQP